MNWPDSVNAAFELSGFLAGLQNCRVLRRDKKVRGVSFGPTVFFVVWGCWNLYYYPHLHQLASLTGSALLTATNMIYGCMLVYYGDRT